MTWERIKLGDLVDFQQGYAFKAELFNNSEEGLPLARIRDVKRGFSETYYSGEYDERFILSRGDILIGMDGDFNIAKWQDEKALLNQRVSRIRAKTKRIDMNYLFHFMPAQLLKIWEATSFATVKHLSSKSLNAIEIPLPPLPIQQRIAAVLDEVDALRQKREESKKLCRILEVTAFSEIFSSYLDSWENKSKTIAEIENFLTSGSRGWAQYYSEVGESFLRIQNVGDNRILINDIAFVGAPDSAEARRTKTKSGDVVISITADLGRSGVIEESISGAYINQHLAIIRQDYFMPHYLSGFIASPFGQKQIQSKNKGGVKAGLNFDDLRAIRIADVPLNAQERYHSALIQIRGIENEAVQSSAKIETLQASLQARAFAGELALRELEGAL